MSVVQKKKTSTLFLVILKRVKQWSAEHTEPQLKNSFLGGKVFLLQGFTCKDSVSFVWLRGLV